MEAEAGAGAPCHLLYAFCCVQHVQYRLWLLGNEMSADVIRRELNALEVSILVEGPDQTSMARHLERVRMPGEYTEVSG